MPTLKTEAPPARIRLDNEWLEVDSVRDLDPGMAELEIDGGTTWIVADSEETAGQAARDYWLDMAENDPEEFRCMVGDETLVRWSLGQPAGPGSAQVCSLSDWLDLWLDTPEEHFASWDGNPTDVDAANVPLIDELGFTPTVAYRSN